jgi:hypothetical protein
MPTATHTVVLEHETEVKDASGGPARTVVPQPLVVRVAMTGLPRAPTHEWEDTQNPPVKLGDSGTDGSDDVHLPWVSVSERGCSMTPTGSSCPYQPKAMHWAADEQESELRNAPAVDGSLNVVGVHTPWCRCSMSACPSLPPTAMHDEARTQVTAPSVEPPPAPPDGSRELVVQVWPDIDATTPLETRWPPASISDSPTDRQEVAVGQDTPLRKTASWPVGTAIVVGDQVPDESVSISATLPVLPTATHDADEPQATETSLPPDAPGEAKVDVVHFPLVNWPTRGRVLPPVTSLPTAVHDVIDWQVRATSPADEAPTGGATSVSVQPPGPRVEIRGPERAAPTPMQLVFDAHQTS